VTRRRRLALALVSAGIVAVGIGAEWEQYRLRFGLVAQLDLLTGVAVAAFGVLASARVPRSRIGPLLVAAGVAWFIGTAAGAKFELAFLYMGFLVHALFTFPTGRLKRPLEGLLVVGGYGVALLPPLWASDSSEALLAALLEAGLVIRYATATRGERLQVRYSTALGTVLAIAFATKALLASWVSDAGAAVLGEPGTVAEVALVVTAFGLTWALIVLERRRRLATDLVVEIGGEHGDPYETLLGDGSAEDPVMLAAAERATELRSRNQALRAELAGQVVKLEASRRRLLEAADDERAALETVLRSGAMARLSEVGSRLAILGPDLSALAPESRPHVDRSTDQLQRTLTDLDAIARGLDPGLLAERGLTGALCELGERSPVPVEVELDPSVHPSSRAIAATLYYVASEALANVARHSGAAMAWLRLRRDATGLVLVVEDDGIGGAGGRIGGGLLGLHDRLDTLGGSLSVGPRAGGGTRLSAWIPAGVTAAPPVVAAAEIVSAGATA
jgi:signal transduction histidine kinase